MKLMIFVIGAVVFTNLNASWWQHTLWVFAYFMAIAEWTA